MELIATCAFGLEKLVYDEIKKLGLWVIKNEDGRVTFEGDANAMVRANFWLRCADRIQIKVGEFKAATFDELFDAVNALEWEKYIGENDSFPVAATSVKSVLHSEPAIQSIVKKAVVKRLQQAYKKGSGMGDKTLETLLENSGATFQIIAKVNKDQFVISIDSSGESLHKRGYRQKANLAPIKETLAAALVKLSDWPMSTKPSAALATEDSTLAAPQTPASALRSLVDPFCGSGTILIEAALINQNIAPGLTRQFAFQQWPWVDQKMVTTLRNEARTAIKPLQKLPMYGFDIDPSALKVAEENAKKSGITSLGLKRADFNDLDFSKFENCTFITNPPYGERLEDRAKVEEMYRQFGKKFAQTKNCSLFIITSNENFPRLFGRPADKNRKLFNGNIRCYLFSFFSK